MRLHAFAVAAALAAAATGSAAAQAPTLELQVPTHEVVAGDSLRISIVARDRNGMPTSVDSVFWAVGPFEIASISPDGMLRTYRRGSARVIARTNGNMMFTDIEIRPKPPATLEVTADAPVLVPGGRTALHAMARDRDHEPLTDATYAFRSLDPAIATVTPGGLVEAVRPGTARLEASLGGVRQLLPLKVIANPVARLAVRGAATARTGDVVTFRASPVGAGGTPVTGLVPAWSVSGEGATVYADGAFVASKPGAYLVTATFGERAATAAITVTPRVHERKVELVTSRIYGDLQAAELWAINDALYVSTIADRLYTYDISDPANPRLADSVMVDARLINDVMTNASGTIGVLSREGASNRKNGIVFLDLASPLHPKVISEYTETVSSGVHSIYVDGHYVYLTDDGHRLMRVIDFQDPAHPREVGQWAVENSVLQGAEPMAGAAGARAAAVNGRYLHDLQVVDGIAYLAYFKDGLIILDVGNGIRGGSPEHPAFVSQFTYNTTDFYPPDMLAGTHTIFRFGTYLVVGDEVFPQFYDFLTRDHIKTLGRLHILDVSDLAHPTFVAFYEVPGQGSHNAWVEDGVLYVGNFEAGVRVVDVSGELRGDLRAQGREIGTIWSGSAKGFRANVPMAWGAQPHKGYLYATDMNSGLWVGKLTPAKQVP